jgi:hypothetical protein
MKPGFAGLQQFQSDPVWVAEIASKAAHVDTLGYLNR